MQKNSSTTKTPQLKACIGLVVDSATRRLVRCPKSFRPARANRKYHSKQCYDWTWRRLSDRFSLGDLYVKGQHRKRHAPKTCGGWAILDGVFAPCEEAFTQGRADKKYHSLECFRRTRRWRQIGYHLGDAVRRTCAYRNCKKGFGGTRGTFDQIHRSLKSGRYFCDHRCQAAENRARDAERIARELELLRGAQRPKDWWDKPLDWRIIGGELLSREGPMSNLELGERLDVSRILSCPYHGDGWETALGRVKRAVDYVWEIRRWVNRPAKKLSAKRSATPVSVIRKINLDPLDSRSQT